MQHNGWWGWAQNKRDGIWTSSSCYLLISQLFQLLGMIQSWFLSQKSGGFFGDDVPGLQDVVFGCEPGCHNKPYDEFAVNFSRADMYYACLVHSPQQLPGQNISFLQQKYLQHEFTISLKETSKGAQSTPELNRKLSRKWDNPPI